MIAVSMWCITLQTYLLFKEINWSGWMFLQGTYNSRRKTHVLYLGAQGSQLPFLPLAVTSAAPPRGCR